MWKINAFFPLAGREYKPPKFHSPNVDIRKYGVSECVCGACTLESLIFKHNKIGGMSSYLAMAATFEVRDKYKHRINWV